MDIVVYIGSALLCFAQQCHPVLISNNTPTGEFIIRQRIVSDPLYGGSVLQFAETQDEVYAIHKIWNGRPKEKRFERIRSNNPKDRIITHGCINVDESVYNELVNNYQGSHLVIQP